MFTVADSPFFFGGILALMSSISPDHLCALVMLSAGIQDTTTAFYVGSLWGLSHCVGMAVVCLVFIYIHRTVAINENLEYFGRYFGGILMMGVGVYFIRYEDLYVEQKSDGEFMVRSCGCHSPHESTTHNHTIQCSSCDDHNCDVRSNACESNCCESDERQPLIASHKHVWFDSRTLLTAITGLLQGVLCPSCLLAMGIAGQVDNHLSNLMVAEFTLTLFVSMLVCTGVIAASASVATRYGAAWAKVNPLRLYRFGCYCAIFVGLAFISANYLGVLEKLDVHPQGSPSTV